MRRGEWPIAVGVDACGCEAVDQKFGRFVAKRYRLSQLVSQPLGVLGASMGLEIASLPSPLTLYICVHICAANTYLVANLLFCFYPSFLWRARVS
jgi:hypothetical protein